VARQACNDGKAFVASECPLAGIHISQGIGKLNGAAARPELLGHPIELLARAYGVIG
jgi:glycerol-3-phosphate dehydrogenase subunit C